MAGQKKDASTAILRRVLDRTPIRPVHQDSPRPQAQTPAQFAARYFNRENRVIQRLLGIGGDFSPIHRTIGRNIIARFADFNLSFGPIQRALRPQPEHTPRRRPRIEAGQDYTDYVAEDFNYSSEPAFSEQPIPLLSQYVPNDYAAQVPAALPWEAPLDSLPHPVARRTEFQPANLRYLTNPEQPAQQPVAVQRQIASPSERPVNQPAEQQSSRTATAVSQNSFQAAPTVGQAFNPTAGQTSVSPARDATPLLLEASQPGQGPGQLENNRTSIAPVTPLTQVDLRAPRRSFGYGEADFPPDLQPMAQPALSRALQRTFEATAAQPGPTGVVFNQASYPGASPATVARHFAAPPTMARYRAVKQAADKVFLGEQLTWESASAPAFEPQANSQVLNLPPVQRAVLETAPAQEATTQQAAAVLQEARRVREETGALLETQQGVTTAAQMNPTTAQPSLNLKAPQPEAAANPGNIQRAPDAALAPAIQPGVVQVTGPNRGVAASEGVSIPGEALVRRNIQPEPTQFTRLSGLSGPETTLARFDAAIPASLLENDPVSGETAPEVGRLTGSRLSGPTTTSGWATKLAALRNNPGVEARTSVARQVSEPENVAASAADVWTDAGPVIYYDRRRARRSQASSEVVETQDRIFSLADNNSSLTSFQPQLMQGLVAEAVTPTPAQPVVNRSPLAAPQTDLSFERTNASNREIVSPANPPVNRVYEAAEFAGAVASDGSVTTPAQGHFSINNQNSPADPTVNSVKEAVSAGEMAVAGQINPPSTENPARLSTNPVEPANQPDIYSKPVSEAALPGQVQRTVRASSLQPTALQRVFKRLDLEDTESGAFAENSGFDFANLSLSYAARPGSRPHRVAQTDDQSSLLPGYDYASQSGPYEAAYRENNFVSQPAREAGFESPTYHAEPSVARAYTGSDAAIPARENAGEMPTQPNPAELANEAAQVAGESGFTGQPVSSDPNSQGVQRTLSPFRGSEAARPNQTKYFANSLEAAWISPENRLLVERLPGGSGALQRLMHAPGQLQAFLEQHPAGSTANLSLSSLRHNPGLSSSVARALEDASITDNTSVDGSWSGGPILNFVQRRRTIRQVQDGFGDSESGAVASEFSRFEPALPNPNNLSFAGQALPGQVTQDQPEVNRQVSQLNRSGTIQRSTAVQPAGFQSNANRETLARIQGNTTEPGQPGSGANFTISSDWVAQLQRRFEGMAVGQLRDSTGQIMRFLNNEGADFTGFVAGQNYGVAPDFNYAVPPLLWRKVSDYAPQGGLPANPRFFGEGQPAISYTSPGEVLRAYEQGETYQGLPDDAAYPALPGGTATPRQDGSFRLDLPRLQQTHQLLQRIANLEKTNTSLELAHRMEAAAQTPGKVAYPVQPGSTPLSMPFSPAIQRQSEMATRFNNQIENYGEGRLDSAEGVAGQTALAPLRMTDVPVNRPAADGRSLEVEGEWFADEDFALPAPEIRTIEVRVPDHRTYSTPLETAAARNGSNGPNIGQGEILQPLAIQRKASTNGPGQAATYAPLAQPNLHNIIKTSVGRTLDHPVQRKMTNIFGAHFQDVKVHTGEEAAEATRHVGAEAFTLGSDIYFAPGRYQPDSQVGQALIGHELTHVIQQSSLPSLGGGRIPETSSLGQSLEHHAIANEQLLLRHLSNTHDDHYHHSFSSDDSGRLSFGESHSSHSYSRGTATIERSYQPMSEQNNHPPINPSHIRTDSGSGSMIQREVTIDDMNSTSSSGGSVDVNDIIKNQENMDKLARKVYQIIRDELIIERERGFGPGNGKFF